MAKQLNARIQTKHDKEENWKQAAAFIPKAGEFIIYDASEDTETLEYAKQNYLNNKTNAAARTEYETELSKTVPRIKVGTGDKFLSKLSFLTAPYVQKVDGKDLSDNNLDDAAFTILNEAKTAKAKDVLQFIDTKYKAGLGTNIILDTSNPPSTASNYIYNTGALDLKESPSDGYIDVVIGNGDGTSTTKSIYIHGLNSSAFQSQDSLATAQQGQLAETAIQSLAVKSDEKSNIYYFNSEGEQFFITLPLGKLAFQDGIEYSQISSYLSTFVGATPESNGETGLVPAPEVGQLTDYVLTGDGKWTNLGKVTMDLGSGLTYFDGKVQNTGLLSVYQDGTNLCFTIQGKTDDNSWVSQTRSFPLGAGVSWSSTLTSGQQVGTLTIDGVKNVLYAPVASDRVAKSGDTMNGALTVESTISATGNISTSANITASGTITGSQVFGAYWNDYAEYRAATSFTPGLCVHDTPSGTMELTNARLLPSCKIISDTFGFAIGKTSSSQTPVAVSGRALVYTDDAIEIGDCLCSGENGKLSKMTREEIQKFPDRIVGIVSEIPSYSYWGEDNIPVNGRIWVYVR